MAHGKDFIENYFDYGFDARRRRIFLHDDINDQSIYRLVLSLMLLDESSNEKPIEIILSSCGGEEYEMLTAYDIIRSCKCKVIGYAHGKIMSATPLILRACDEAYCYPSTQFMVHESWYGLDSRHNNAKATIAHYDDMTKLWAELMAKHTKLSSKQWLNLTERTGRDKYFDADKALEYGLIDGIYMHDGTIFKGE